MTVNERDTIVSLVKKNSKSKQPDELIVSIAYKESTFDQSKESATSTATGLMMVTKGAAKEAGYKYADVKNDPAINIQAGTKYLQIRIDRAGGNLLNGLNGYGTGAGYGNNIIKCEQSLIRNPENPIKALSQIYKQ